MISYDKAARKEIIASLQKKAKEILDLKKQYRQKRPIVIEFSGSPKSGKTTCINSLELFLKRNGFSVEVVQERASICPVADKVSPMFNIWTACTSITGMISYLECKDVSCDVLILDRGVFDAFCWFDWLHKKQSIGSINKKAIESFLSLDLIINRIDIVFAFTVAPDVSIEREYANLLTDKHGTIMSQKVLGEYLNSIKHIMEVKEKYFHAVFGIDTENKKQDDVGKEVTEKTLEALKTMLMERIGYLTPTDTNLSYLQQHRFLKCQQFEFETIFGSIEFDMRSSVESNPSLLQPVPIAVITDKEKQYVLTVKKRKNAVSEDSPEKDKILLYVGGHSRAEDLTDINSKDLLSVCRYTLHREVKEELGISISFDEIEPYIIYTPDIPKSKQHVAICFIVERDDIDELKFRIDEKELILNRGTSKSGTFQSVSELFQEESQNLEPWSIEIINNLFNHVLMASPYQLSMFD
jgi:predicted NUDIX family phosphoesterase/thymidylate kinase